MDIPEQYDDFSEEIISELDRDIIGDFRRTENQTVEENSNSNDKSEKRSEQSSGQKLFHVPLTRVRNLMKLDPDVSIASNEAVFVVARCSELFIESLVREAYTQTVRLKKKTVAKRDVDIVISTVDGLMFLDGSLI